VRAATSFQDVRALFDGPAPSPPLPPQPQSASAIRTTFADSVPAKMRSASPRPSVSPRPNGVNEYHASPRMGNAGGGYASASVSTSVPQQSAMSFMPPITTSPMTSPMAAGAYGFPHMRQPMVRRAIC